MTLDEFEEQNPILTGKTISYGKDSKYKSIKQAMLQQGKFFKTHTFIFNTLGQRDAEILRLRFGLTDDKIWTYQLIGDKLGLTAERIRVIIDEALIKLRHPARIKLLMNYTDETFNLLEAEKIITTHTLIHQDIIKRRGKIIHKEENCKEEQEFLYCKDILIESLNLTNRTYLALKRANINTVYDIIDRGCYFKDIRFLGEGCEQEVLDKLYELGVIVKCDKIVQNDLNKDELLGKIFVSQSGFSDKICNVLIKARVLTLKDLIDLKQSIINIEGMTKILKKSIINRLNQLGIDFNKKQEVIDITNPQLVFIKDLNFTSRTYNLLMRYEIKTLEDLINYLNYILDMGPKCKQEILDKLYKLGIIIDLKNYADKKINIDKQIFNKILIYDMNFSARVYHLLQKKGIKTLQDLILAQDDIEWISTLNVIAEKEILNKLYELGIKLDVEEWRV